MNTLLWTIYGIGVVLTPIVFGISCGKSKCWNIWDDGVPIFFLSFMWPVLVAAAAVIGAIGCVCCVLGWLWTFLLEFGSLIASWLERDKKKDGEQ